MKVVPIEVNKNDKKVVAFIDLHESKERIIRLTRIEARNLAKKILLACEGVKEGEKNDRMGSD